MIRRLSFLLWMLCTLVLLSACNSSTTSATTNAPATTGTALSGPQSGLMPFDTVRGDFHEYALPQVKSGVMRPGIDHQGRIWFGEMGQNALAVFDPRNQRFQQIALPDGAYGIMGIAVASDDSIWFSEQNANYIGHYNPTTKQFQTYHLPMLTTPNPSNKKVTLTLPSGPNDVAIDPHGNVWFTEMNADSLGMLDVKTGLFKYYPLSPTKTVQTINPYGITIDPHGIVWFTEASTNHLGRLDPGTGEIHLFTAPGPSDPLMEVASDPHGTIWSTTFDTSTLLKFDPTSESFTPYLAPDPAKSSQALSGGLYGLTVTASGAIWVTVTAANVVAHFDTTQHHFDYYAVPTPGSLPLGIVAGTDQACWFTEATGNKLGELAP